MRAVTLLAYIAVLVIFLVGAVFLVQQLIA